MSRESILVMLPFRGDSDIQHGVMEHVGGGHICYWQAPRGTLPPKGRYQVLLKDGFFALRDHPAELHRVGAGRGIELGINVNDERWPTGKPMVIDTLIGLHRCHDGEGMATYLEVLDEYPLQHR